MMEAEIACLSLAARLLKEAIAEAHFSLNAFCETEEEKDQFEILAVVRQGADIDAKFKP